MACFLVPTTEAIVTTIVKKTTDKKETHNPFIKRLNWLNNMLWGGSALLVTAVWAGIVAVTNSIVKRPIDGELQVQTK